MLRQRAVGRSTDRWDNWVQFPLKKRLLLKGWRLFIGTILVGYPLFFGLLWSQQTEKPFAGAVVHYGLLSLRFER
jgi:hypothetical protein